MSTRSQLGRALGFKLQWVADQTPSVTAAREDVVQEISADLIANASTLASMVHTLHTSSGLLLPYFWAIVKTSAALKRDTYRWWRLDECSKHLLATWILSRDQPKALLAARPILWEIYPTIVIGSEVQARVGRGWEIGIYNLRADAEPSRYRLYEWNMGIDAGSCTLLRGTDQILVSFGISELYDDSLIRLVS